MSKDINKEIEQMADQLQKSTETPQESLFNVIKSLGPVGLKERLPTLNDEDKVILKAALAEMTLNKAVSFDKEIESAKVIQGKLVDTIIQEEIGSDDADEKLMKPAAAHQDHQGTPTDGWQGQVIKSVHENEENLDYLVEKMMGRAEEAVVVAKCEGMGMDKKKVQGSIDKYKKKKKEDMEKAQKMSREDAKEKIMGMEEKEHKTKDPKKLVDSEKKEHSMKKSDEELEKAKAKMNKEEDQLGDAPDLENGKQMAKKSPAPNIEDNAKANKKNMTKSVVWEDDKRLIKANTYGRNFHFNVEQFVEETLKTEVKEPIKKSEPKEDINDLIAKSMDTTWGDIGVKKSLEENKSKQNGTLIKSFDEIKDLAAACNISEDEAKKILGL